MKKGLVLGLAGLFLLTGCGNKVKCTSDDATYEATFKKDNITKITITAMTQGFWKIDSFSSSSGSFSLILFFPPGKSSL